jgi:L-alanine-DL-glutamate epimerase-like enolase superfamily enzyme
MNITRLTLWQVPLTSHIAYNMSDGKICDTVTTNILRLEAEGGLTGWGEVCPIPHYLPAYADGIAPALAELAPVIFAGDGLALGVEGMMRAAEAWLPAHEYAKSPLDIALWDLTARKAGLPLHMFLGGMVTADLPIYHSISCLAPDEMARIAREETARGITQIQVKLGADRNNEADIARLRLVCEVVPSATLVYGDWNCGASRLDATRVGRAVANLDVMLEQPCATLEECAAVRVATGLAMKIDENAHDTASLLRGWQLGCMDAVALKLSKFGGLSALRRARDLCLDLGVKMCIEDTWGSDIATGAALHLAAATPKAGIMNVCDLSGYVSPRLDPDAPSREGGHIAPSSAPGIGVNPDREALGAPVLELSA